MTAHYLEGVLLLGVMIVPVAETARTWRRLLLPSWDGPETLVAELIATVAVVTIVAELLGVVDLFAAGPLASLTAALGIAAWVLGRRRLPSSGPVPAELPGVVPVTAGWTRATTAVAWGATSVVVAEWAARTVDAYHHGMTTVDSLWYHLPFAARFSQTGSILPLHYVDSDPVTVFFPANSEILHGIGMVLMGNDVLSPMINLGWLAVALLAGWCIGRPFGVAPVSMTGVAVLMATPGLVATQPGGAYDDIVGIALLLSGTALLIHAERYDEGSFRPACAVASLAAGLALGTKYTFITPVMAMTIGVLVVSWRRRRMGGWVLWLAGLVLTGSLWYLRNLVYVGNPLPTLHLKLGPVSLPSPESATPSSTLAQFLFKAGDWHRYFLPGLRLSFGPVWWAVLGAAAAGLLLGTLVREQVPRMLAWVGIVTAFAFVLTPQYLALFGAPLFFVDNIRYADVAFVLGLCVLPLTGPFRAARRSQWLLGGYTVTIALTQLDGTVWPTGWLGRRFAPPISVTDSIIGLVIGLVVFGAGLVFCRWHAQWTHVAHRFAIVMGAAVLAVVGGLVLQWSYLQDRYAQVDQGVNFPLARHISGSRIGVAGAFTQLQYELYGNHLSNYVQYLGEPHPHRGYSPVGNCVAWRDAVNRGGYRYLVVSTGFTATRASTLNAPFTYKEWTASDPSSTLLQYQVRKGSGLAGGSGSQYVAFFLFRIRGPLDPSVCSSPDLRNLKPTQG